MIYSSAPMGQTALPAPPKAFASAALPWPWAGLIALALGAQLALIWTHIPWADELQATALARESHTLADWYWNFRYEGHAPLWHLLLKIPLAFTDDPTALKIVQSVVVLCSAAVLHLRAPFSPGVKFLLSLNYFLFFEYGVIARNYSLTVLFFFAAIAYRRQPIAWLWIALLPQGGLQSVMLAGICGILALREQGWKWWGVALAGCGGIVALVWMWPAEDFLGAASVSRGGTLIQHFARTAYVVGSSAIPVDRNFELPGQDFVEDTTFVIGLGLASPVMAIVSMWRGFKFLTVLSTLFLISNCYLSTAIYGLSGRHFGLWPLLLIGLLWTALKSNQRLPIFILIWMIVLALSGAIIGLREMTTPFSTAELSASALREAKASDAIVTAADTLVAAEVNGMLRIPTYNISDRCLQTFIRWRRPKFPDLPILRPNEQIGLVAEPRQSLAALKMIAAQTGGRVFMLLDHRAAAAFSQIEEPAISFLRFLGKDAMSHQWRYLYRLDVPPDANPTPIPACSG